MSRSSASQQAQATRAVSGLVVCFTESELVCERSAGLIYVPGGTIDEREASGKGLSGASDAVIQALCRWQSLDSLRTYALLDAPAYKGYIQRAMESDSQAVRRHELPTLDAVDVGPASDLADIDDNDIVGESAYAEDGPYF